MEEPIKPQKIKMLNIITRLQGHFIQQKMCLMN